MTINSKLTALLIVTMAAIQAVVWPLQGQPSPETIPADKIKYIKSFTIETNTAREFAERSITNLYLNRSVIGCLSITNLYFDPSEKPFPRTNSTSESFVIVSNSFLSFVYDGRTNQLSRTFNEIGRFKVETTEIISTITNRITVKTTN
jgi:hypothetical protein